MSLFGSLNTAISGLGAQSAAFNNISDNVANSQSVGFKRVDTSFTDYLTTSTPSQNVPGSVTARPVYVNNVQGTISQSDNPLSLAITGQGFFAVSVPTGSVKGVPTFSSQQYYTRAGDFSMNSSGFLVNSQGQYLNGWSVDPTTGVAVQNALQPIQISQQTYNLVSTSNIDLSANLPATPTAGTATASSPLSSTVQVYDALGRAQTLTLDWSQAVDSSGATIPNTWNVSISSGTATSGLPETATVSFGGTVGSTHVPAGTISDISNVTQNGNPVTLPAAAMDQAASIPLSVDFGTGSGAQTINLRMGTYGGTSGVTQYAGNAYNLRGLTQDGVPPGSFSGVNIQDDGTVVLNYSNGQTRTIAQVPVVTFNAPNALQRENGQAFIPTVNSGTPVANIAGTNGAGGLATGEVESSNVNIATEFSQLIVAQQAYSANAKVVTASDQLLQVTMNMKT